MLIHNNNNFDCTIPRNSHSIDDLKEEIQNILSVQKYSLWHGRVKAGALKRTSVQTIAIEHWTELAGVNCHIFVILHIGTAAIC